MTRRHGLTAAALVLCTFAASAQELQAGRDYDAITPAQATDDASKVVVTEFFSYACPHCFSFNPTLTIWENRLPKDVRFERVAVVFGKGAAWQKLAQVFYALNTIGKTEQLSPAVFGAMHVERADWQTDAKIVDWMAARGVNRSEFETAFKSFNVRQLVVNGDQIAAAHKVRSVPTLVVDGKYARQIVDNANADFPQQLAIVDRLIDKARAEKKRQ